MPTVKKRRILVVDDDESIRTFLGHVLTEEGYEVTLVNGYDEALASVQNETYDLVITDVMMPGKDGIDLLTELKGRMPGLKVVVMSGVGRKAVLLEIASVLEADSVLEKPFGRQALLTAVRELAPPKY